MARRRAASAPLPPWLAAVANKPEYHWALSAWKRAAASPGAWFDAAKADAVVARWPSWFRFTSDRFAGVPFRLTVWQEIVVRLLVGWKRPSANNIDPLTGKAVVYQVRVFSRLLLWVPRKNGKTEFLAALALLFFVHERVIGSEGYCFARDEDQARVAFSRMKAMVAADRGLTDPVAPRVTMTARGIYVAETNSLFQLLSGKPDGKHGRMPQIVLGDEMHEWESLDLADTLRQGTGNRLQPVELYASTAGIKTYSAGWELWEEASALIEGASEDTSTLAVIFAAGPDDDWRSEETWARANPTIGLTPTWDYLRKEAEKAKGNPRAESAFRRYHLNQWVEQIVRWLPAEKWAACAPDPEAWRARAEALRGRRCVGAVDASANLDVTALVWLFPPEEPGEPYLALPRLWVPEATLQARARRDRATPWLDWARTGALETTPGEVIDQNYLVRAICDGLETYAVEALGFDGWNTTKLKTDLVHEGVDPSMISDIRQGHQTLGEPTRLFERLVYSGLFDHGGHPALAWMARNATVRFDSNMNFVVDRKRSKDKIDGIAASVMALALTMRADTSSASPWDDPAFSMAPG